jgi:hypothetical protein
MSPPKPFLDGTRALWLEGLFLLRCDVGEQLLRVLSDGAAFLLGLHPSFTVAQPLWEMTGGLLAMEIRTGEG